MRHRAALSALLALCLLRAGRPALATDNDVGSGPFDPRDRYLSAERPDITDSTSTVGRGVLQLESGVTLGRSGENHHVSAPDMLLRIGTSTRAEIRIGVPTLTLDRANDTRASGLSDAQISFKMRLTKPGVGRGLLHPKLSLTAQAQVPTGSSAVGEPNWQPGVKLGVGYALGERASVTMNLVHDRASAGGVRFDRTTASASFEFKPSTRVHPILEYLRQMPTAPGAADTGLVDVGVAVWARKDLAFDALVGINVDGTDAHFLTFGVTRRW